MPAPRSDDPEKADTLVDTENRSTEAVTLVRTGQRAPTLASAATELRVEGPFAGVDSEPRIVATTLAPPASGGGDSRYMPKRVLGEGGMGEVRLCGDAFIGRDVAMKVIRSHAGPIADAKARFLREARVQGQLEHPSVVPVYDIGTTAAGELYFTMKRIAGLTLEEIISGLRANDPRMVSEFSRRRLLSALSQTCLALAFAHTRGVVHRDLKPANVMLGDFGEVYVLDWGIAKVGDMPEIALETDPSSVDPAAKTRAGALLGTPGYMAPEQARGEASTVDARADVYALGVILHELLTLEPLHRGKSLMELIASTVAKPSASPREVAPETPPELDAICARATAREAEDRFATAREMHLAIERFLDGERDLERRRALARTHAEEAARALASAEEAPAGSEEKRAQALRSLGTALALDPEEATAQRALGMLFDDSAELPPEAERELFAQNLADRTRAARASTFAYASWFLMTPILFWMGVRSIGALMALDVVLLALIGYVFWIWKTGSAEPRYVRVWMVGSFVAVSLLSVFFGPLVLVPQVAVSSAAAMSVGIRANVLTRRALTVLSVLASLVPLGLSWLGLIPSAYTFVDGAIVVLPFAVGFPPVPTLILLIATTIYAIVLSARLLGQATEVLVQSERRTFARAFRLRQMLPALEDVRST